MSSDLDSNDPLGTTKNSIFGRMLRAAFSEQMKDVKTDVPGYIVSFDPISQRAQVQIGVKTHLSDGRIEDPTLLIEVPVNFWGTSGGTLESRVSQGDEGLIFFSQECIDGWADQGGIAVKPEMRRFDQNDAFFIPGFRSRPNAISDFANNGIRLRNKSGDAYYWIKDDRTVEVGGGQFVVKCPAVFEQQATVNGHLETVTTIANQGVDIGKLHPHTGVTAGNATSGPVAP